MTNPLPDQNLYTEFNLTPFTAHVASYVSIFLPLIMTGLAFYLWEYVTPLDITLFLVFYILTGLGVTIGLHRYFSHHSFKCAKWFQYVLAILGCMALQGPIIYWVANHRKHHQFTDVEGDPHSPNLENKNWIHHVHAFFHAHWGWILKTSDVSYNRYAFDILSNSILYKLSHHAVFFALLGVILPGIIGGLWTQSWQGAGMAILWGGFVRICAMQTTTYSVNSFGHLFGKKTYPLNNNSRDNWILGIVAFGDGWHNSHHAFPTSARHGLKFWQLDISYLVIRLLERLGIVWDVKLPKISWSAACARSRTAACPGHRPRLPCHARPAGA